MKQKLALSCTLIHHPSVLFLDEPTTGIDAVSRGELWDMLQTLKEKGITILVSTPYMDEASLCDRIALCNEGRILGIDTPQGIVEKFDSGLYAIRADNMFTLLEAARKVEGVVDCYPFGQMHHLIADTNFSKLRFMEQLDGLSNLTIKPAKPTIEDVFIKLMKQ
jgi:ABC-type multidrug transport system ATPase subunit